MTAPRFWQSLAYRFDLAIDRLFNGVDHGALYARPRTPGSPTGPAPHPLPGAGRHHRFALTTQEPRR